MIHNLENYFKVGTPSSNQTTGKDVEEPGEEMHQMRDSIRMLEQQETEQQHKNQE